MITHFYKLCVPFCLKRLIPSANLNYDEPRWFLSYNFSEFLHDVLSVKFIISYLAFSVSDIY